MLRRFLLGALVVSLASMAWAGVPDLEDSFAETDAPAGASVYVVPNGSGSPLSEAFAVGGAQVDATITLTLIDTDGNLMFQYPFEDLWLETSLGGLVYCENGTSADASTDINGQTTWSNPILGGGYTDTASELVQVYVAGAPLAGAGLNIQFNSADINGDLAVNLSDIVAFTQVLGGTFDEHPLFAGDYNNDGIINLSDIVRFTPGIGTQCN